MLRMKMNEAFAKFFNFYVILDETKIVPRLYFIRHSVKIFEKRSNYESEMASLVCFVGNTLFFTGTSCTWLNEFCKTFLPWISGSNLPSCLRGNDMQRIIEPII